jgi:hypothetical protein
MGGVGGFGPVLRGTGIEFGARRDANIGPNTGRLLFRLGGAQKFIERDLLHDGVGGVKKPVAKAAPHGLCE